MNQGKTTRLYHHYLERLEGDGFLSIKYMDKDNVHHYDLLHLNSNQKIPFIIHENFFSGHEKIRFKIGPYLFYDDAFKFIEQEINTIIKNNISPVYFDEVGMLEVDKNGFYQVIKACLENDLDVYMTVREDLIDRVMEAFSIQEYEVINEKSI
jgi:nucleoside-triphosphatase THEP1